ncbi:chemotaxis protein CheA [Mesorhizobium sp. M00.F.Ca.ET.151.01.1.1]|uniref:histidine kinase n=1 Tax=Stenotrophomonas pavanii TaxID=487698 RepID=A0ABM7R3F9_9GAMM|nr:MULTISPECIES: chemotaxis protein CheA [Stenotrophomonas]MBC9081137.1 chemotaxis protein CheA [Stenotrophomonas maltophilia]TGR55838.1 chemotaxis protein CheA [bacterium M00.F.Ca.ET.199.01.1.1]TGT08900.1 chemotaxis protein CheA [bacterium M00.F.Ca.ET.177.01.1.1]TGT66836.1 chemotaxis protein CheA [Mesorhizobium sp. M00.F.Ca.ET.170.01.1.1]TGU15747.1 chemotaxis protein CheA [bacterium M00.F.Ca.ET.163.01.1.1]TGU98475.1 chemotaxis protein CheA [Mesorhizobium sp. M00.F.Ca.ET.151.01.1.1]TGV60140.
MSAVSDDITADFIIEAQEILDRLGEQLVSLEQAPQDGEQLNAVFRGYHTLKGGAGFLGVTAMVELCHAAEEALGAARAGQAVLQAHHFDAAQQSLDYLQSMLDAVSSGTEPGYAPPDLIAQFDVHGGTAAAPVAAAPAAGSSDLITDDEFEALLDQLHGGNAPTAVAPAKKADDGLISEDEFEALLDQLHGGAAPGAKPAAAPAPAPLAAPRPAAAPAPAPKPAAKPLAEAEHTVRVDTKRLDAIVNLIGELVLSRNRLKTLRARLRDEELDRAVSTLDIATARLQSAVMRTRMQPVGKVFSRFPKVARDVARSLKKEVDLELIGAETELDRNLVEALADPLVHLVRNAIDHGVEMPDLREAQGKPRMGHVRLSAQQEGDYVSIEVQDDGAGIDPEKLRAKAREKGLIDPEAAARLSSEECLHLVFLPGFSTKQQVTDISGRGVGMDVVQSRIRELSGQIQIQSELGRGSRFLIRVPLTLAILPTLLVQAGEDVYALPLARVMEVLHAPGTSLGWFDGRAVLDRRSHTLPLVDLRQWLDVTPATSTLLTIVVLQAGEARFGLVVDQVRGREEVVIKPLPKALRGLRGYAGATLIGDGRMALILDVDGLR